MFNWLKTTEPPPEPKPKVIKLRLEAHNLDRWNAYSGKLPNSYSLYTWEDDDGPWRYKCLVFANSFDEAIVMAERLTESREWEVKVKNG